MSTDTSCEAMKSRELPLRRACLEELPSELVSCILRELDPTDLVFVSRTSKTMHFHAMQDFLWENLILKELPCFDTLPGRMRERAKKSSFRELFLEHYPHWFLTRHKIWIISLEMSGGLMIATYDHRRACIDGYSLLAHTINATTPANPDLPQAFVQDMFCDEDGKLLVDTEPELPHLLSGVDIHPDMTYAPLPVVTFNPRIFLHLDRPVFHLEPWSEETEEEEARRLKEEANPGPNIIDTQTRVNPLYPPARSEKRLRPSRGQQPAAPPQQIWYTTESSPPLPMPSPWVRPISVLRSEPGGYAVSTQFLYARELSPTIERYQGTFSLAGSNRDNPPYSTSISIATEPSPSGTKSPMNAKSLQFVFPARGTTASRNLDRVHFPYPIYSVWPPPNVPTQIPGSRETPAQEHRIQFMSIRAGLDIHRTKCPDDHPMSVSQITDRAFYMHTPITFLNGNIGGVHANSSFATIDPYYYTPTADKPFRGIWVGDYGGHGCEFLLIHQPDDDESENNQEELTQLEEESNEDYTQRKQDARIYRGRLEAIKLTGDANVPQGEYSFFAPDLSDSRTIPHGRGMFGGKRVVRARGHIAGIGFQNARVISTRLIVVSFDQLAILWGGAWHITLYHRVDIDQYTNPFQ